MLTKPQFETFMSHKKTFETQILQSRPIIVTTVGKSSTRSMAERQFKRVIMDEATMIKENEAFLASINAQQIVMVGDQKQLGPTHSFKVEGPSSLFSRLIEAGHHFNFLDKQYRMHRSLMEVPNMLYYENRITCGYRGNFEKQFMYSPSPFLFIDVDEGIERLKGTSFYNDEEAEVITQLTNLCLTVFKNSYKLNREDNRVPI